MNRRRFLAALICALLTLPVWSAVAFDASSNATPGGGDLSWTHTPVGTPSAVLCCLVSLNDGDAVNTITYGAASLTEVALSPNAKATGEDGSVYCFFLGAGIQTGAQTVSISVNGADIKAATVVTLTAGANTEVVDTDASINSDSLLDPSSTLSLSGRTSFAMIAFYSGQNATSGFAPLANWTSRQEASGGIESAGFYTFDTIGTSDVTAGWTQTAEDAVAISVAISEVAAGGGRKRAWAIINN